MTSGLEMRPKIASGRPYVIVWPGNWAYGMHIKPT
jgi:hypothetical protein